MGTPLIQRRTAAIRVWPRVAATSVERLPRTKADRRPGLWFAILALMTVVAVEASGAERARNPVLLHNLAGSPAKPGGPFAGVLQRLEARFEPRSLPATPTAEGLAQAGLVWLVLPGRPDGVLEPVPDAAQSAAAILRYVDEGGALLVTAQRSLGEPGSPLAKALLGRLGIVQGTRRTGAKRWTLPERHPLIGGLVWASSGFTPLDAEESPNLRETVLVPNDLTQKPQDPQGPDYAGLVMLWGKLGRGRIVIVGDVDWLREVAWEPGTDAGRTTAPNAVVLDRLVGWAAGKTTADP